MGTGAVPSKPAHVLGTVTLRKREGQTADQALAEAFLDPVLPNAVTAASFVKWCAGDLHLDAAIRVLRDRTQRVTTGNLSDAEAMLTAQATALDAIFGALAQRAHMNMGEHLDATDTYMRLALKAQSQCRSTLETLAEIKCPRAVAFVRQANIAHGHQQVNNGTVPADAARAGENEAQPNELLRLNHGERLDTGTAGITGRIDSPLAPVGTVNRTKD
jgi:hypothetical protein